MCEEVKRWKHIILHHSASAFGTARLIDVWHRERGWLGIGYHFVVLNGYLTGKDAVAGRRFESLVGAIECGRKIDGDEWVQADEEGAHALGYNKDSIGICCIHNKGPYDIHQYDALMHLCEDLCKKFNISPDNVLGHYEVDEKKLLCPGINMVQFRDELKEALDAVT